MFGDMEMVRNAQQDAPTFRRVSLDLSQSMSQRANQPSLRRLSTSSSISSTSSVSQVSSPTFTSSSVPTSHTFWPASGLFRTSSTQLPQPQPLSPIQGTPDVKVPALIRSLSKGMDAFR